MKKESPRKIRWDFIVYGFIILLATFLRFARYDQRWALAYDQARDAIIAQEVVHGKQIPLLGPFSSAGNFTTGPIWYWFVIAATAVNPNAIMTPWIVLTIFYILTIILLIHMGWMIGGPPLGIILGLFAAVSPAQIDQGFNLTNPSLISIFAMLTVWAGVRYIKTGSLAALIVLSLSFGFAVSAHYQAVLLFLYVMIVFFFRRTNWKKLLLFLLLSVIPLIPLIFFDITHKYYNLRGIIDYLRFGQYQIYIPNRWLTYAGIFIPHLWSIVIGGHYFSGYILMGVVAIACVITYLARLFSSYSISLLVSFGAMIVFLRYYRGERFESYFVFLHPFILVLSAWASWILYKKQKILGIIVVGAVIMSSLWIVIPPIVTAKNWTAWRAQSWMNTLMTNYPGEKFDVYDYNYRGTSYSLPLVLYLDHADKLSNTGRKIGFGNSERYLMGAHKEISENMGGFDLWDISSSTSASLVEAGWRNINPDYIYAGVTQWFYK